MPRTSRLAVVIACASLLAACSEGAGAKPAPDDAARDASSALFAAPAAQTQALEMSDLKYSTTALSAKAGEVVEVTLTNKGSIAHDFSIVKWPGEKAVRVEGKDTEGATGKYEVHAHLMSKQTAAVRLKVPAPGTYEYFCTVPGHKEAGMKGTLTVQ